MFLNVFDDYIWSFNVMRLLSQAHFGGGQLSEILEITARVTSRDRESWHREWRGLAERIQNRAEVAALSGHEASATSLYARASEYWRMVDFMLLPDDVRRLDAYRYSVSCFRAATKASGVEPVEIPYLDTLLPGYFVSGRPQKAGRQQPAVVFLGGADSTAEELYFTAARPIVERGFALLIVDGPGQGGALRIGKLPSRPDYELPVAAAVDYLLQRPEVAPGRVVLCAMSLGGYYAARAAAFEHRIAGCVIWGACYDYSEVWQSRPDDHPLAPHVTHMMGAASIREARQIMAQFTLTGILGGVRCPTLVVHGEDDRSVPISHAHRTYAELLARKQLVVFPSGTAGAAHCQQDNLTRANEIIWDWALDLVHGRSIEAAQP
jgi:pimeloyl-ACP methyl ester carboxylesterase